MIGNSCLFLFLHIPHLLPSITHNIHQCPERSHQWIHPFCNMKQWIMCPNAFPQWLGSDAYLAAAILCQVFLQQIAWSLSNNLKPESSVIVLAYILDLHNPIRSLSYITARHPGQQHINIANLLTFFIPDTYTPKSLPSSLISVYS